MVLLTYILVYWSILHTYCRVCNATIRQEDIRLAEAAIFPSRDCMEIQERIPAYKTATHVQLNDLMAGLLLSLLILHLFYYLILRKLSVNIALNGWDSLNFTL